MRAIPHVYIVYFIWRRKGMNFSASLLLRLRTQEMYYRAFWKNNAYRKVYSTPRVTCSKPIKRVVDWLLRVPKHVVLRNIEKRLQQPWYWSPHVRWNSASTSCCSYYNRIYTHILCHSFRASLPLRKFRIILTSAPCSSLCLFCILFSWCYPRPLISS